jgi:hypothetical protein
MVLVNLAARFGGSQTSFFAAIFLSEDQMTNQQDDKIPPPDSDNNFSRGAPSDREDRIRQRAYELWEREGRAEGRAHEHWERAAQELEREEAAIQRAKTSDMEPGVRVSSTMPKNPPDKDGR